jgi:aminodeoxyfutalosine synthase
MLNADVLTLGMAADEQRRRALPANVVTYLRVQTWTIDGGAGNQGEGDSARQVPNATGEVRLYAAPGTLEEAIAHVRAMTLAAQGRRVTAFSWTELEERGWSDPSALQQLARAGLNDLAELPIDRIDDIDVAIEALVAAGVPPRRLTVAQPLGAARTELLTRAQRAFDAHPSLRRFSPLPRVAPIDKPTTGYDDVRMVALARLALPERSIEVDWQLYGPKLAQVALTFGADHLDAVAASDDLSLGPRRATVEDVERNIRAAGFEPRALTRDEW